MDNNIQFDIDTTQETPVEQFDLSPPGSAIYSQPEIAKDKASKFAFGVDADPTEIQKQLETGGEHYLREAYANQEALNRRELRNKLLVDAAARTKGPLTSDDLAEFDALIKLDTNVDPKTVLEEAYGKKFSNLSFQSAKDVTVHKETLDVVPNLAMDGLDAVGSAIARREVASEILQGLNLEHEASASQLTIGNAAKGLGYGILGALAPTRGLSESAYSSASEKLRLPLDYFQMLLPAYASLKLGGWRWSTGESLKEQYQNFSLMSPSEFRTEFERTVSELAKDNLPLAMQFAAGYLQYSNSDAALDNVVGYADWVGTAATVIGTGALIRRGFKGLPKPPSIPDATPTVPEASKGVRVAPVTSEEQLEHIKDFRKALKDTAKAANADSPEEALTTLGDIDAAAEISTHKRLVAEFDGKDPFDDGVDLKNKLPGVFTPHELGKDTGNLTHGQVSRLMGAIHRSANSALRMLTNDAKVVRSTPEQIAKSLEIEKSRMLKEYQSVNDAILDVDHGGPFRVWTPDEQNVNVYTLELRLGEIPGAPKVAPDASATGSKASPAPVASVLPENATPLDRLAKVAAEDYGSLDLNEFKGDLLKESATVKAQVNKLRDNDAAPWEDVSDGFFDPARSDASIIAFLANDNNLEVLEGIQATYRMLTKLKEGNKGKPVTEGQVQKVLDYASGRVEEQPQAPKAPKVSSNPFIASIDKITGARKERVLVRDLYDELKRTGEFKGDFGEFRKTLNELRKSGQIKMSAHTEKLPEPQAQIKRDSGGDIAKAQSEEGNWTSEFKRDIGHGNTTLRNRIIDSEFVVKPRSKYTSPIRAHYVEPQSPSAPSGASSKLPRAKAIYEPAVVENEEQLLTALVDLQTQIAKTPHSSLYDRITKYVNSIERRLVSQVDPGVDNRKFDTDLLGSPYSTKEFKSSAETVEKRKLPPKTRPRDKIDTDIANAYRQLRQSNPNEKWVNLSDLRALLKGHSQKDVDAALKRLFLEADGPNRRAIDLTSWDDQGGLTDANRAGGLKLGQTRMEKIAIEESSAIYRGIPVKTKGGKEPGFSTVGREESPLQLSTKAPDADFVGRDYSATAAPKPWQKRTSPDQIERFRGLEKDVNEYLAALSKNKKTSVVVKLGTPKASLFKSRKAAAFYGTNVYGLDPKRYRIAQQGNGYYISVPKIVNETYDAARDLQLVNNRSSENWFKALVGTILTPDEYVSTLSRQNRKVATYGPSEMHRYVEEMAPTLVSMKSAERDELTPILIANRDAKYEEVTSTGRVKVRRGRFAQTLGAFEREFYQRHGKVPSEAQTTAYFEYVMLHDTDLAMRDLALVRDVARLGLEKTTIGWHTADPENPGGTVRKVSRPFAAVVRDKLPLDDPDGEQWGVWVYDTHAKSGNFYLRSELTKEVLDDITTKTTTHGYKILELGNPLEKPLLISADTDELVNFIVVKDFKTQKYDWNNIPRRPGGHINYQDDKFVKQPVIRKSDRGGKIRSVYEGDEAILNVTTEAQAKKLAKAIDDGRRLLKDNRLDDLKRHLEANTPYDVEEFNGFFRERVDSNGNTLPPRFSLDHEFTWTTGDKNTMDMSHFKAYARGQENFVDAIRSKYNLFANNVDKKYLGERHPDVPSIFEGKHADDQSFMVLTAPRLIDPYESINSALANVSRSKYFNDVKIQTAENFVEEFASVMKTPLDEMRRNPTFYLHNPVWDTTTDNMPRILMGRHVRQAALNLIGSESTLGKSISYTYQKLLNGIYETRGWGQGKADWVSDSLRGTKNPLDLMRSAVFHLKLGLFQPTQLFKQAVTVFNATAISGSASRARDALLRTTAARYLALTDDPEMIAGVAKEFATRTHKLGNFDEQRFIEAYNELRATGLYNVGGEYASRDDLFDPKVFKSKAGQFLDKSTLFFKEGERFPRLLSWFMSYDEWRLANPSKKMTSGDRAWVLDRADLLTNNMSRASNANFQQGSLSIPTQFWSYNMRLAEQLLGTRLTRGERARLLLTNMALWGVPVGATAVTVLPFYDDVRQAALEQGIDLKDPAIQVLHDGIVSAGLSMITGEEYSVGKAYGPGGLKSLKDYLSGESGFLEFIGGASGSVLGDMLKGTNIIIDFLMNLHDPKHTPPTAADLIDFTKNASGVSNAIRAWYMYNTGSYLTNNDVEVLGESAGTDYGASGTDAFMQLAFGLSPTGVDNTYAMLKSNKERREAISAAEKYALKYLKRAFEAEAGGDYTLGEINRRKAKAAMVNIPQDKWSGVIRKATEGNTPLLEKILKDFIEQAPDAETQKARQERGYEMMGVKE